MPPRRILLLGDGDLAEETAEALRAAEADVVRFTDPSHDELRDALEDGADAALVVSNDDAWPLRAQAARALGAIGIRRAVPALEAVLDDPAWWVRANAAAALRSLGRPGRAALERALDHPDRYARDRAREALAMDRVVAV